MTDKRYFARYWNDEYRFEDEIHFFDSHIISEKEFDELFKHERYVAFGESMGGDEVVETLNRLYEENLKLKKEKEYDVKCYNILLSRYDKIMDENKRIKNKCEFMESAFEDIGYVVGDNMSEKEYDNELVLQEYYHKLFDGEIDMKIIKPLIASIINTFTEFHDESYIAHCFTDTKGNEVKVTINVEKK